MRPRIFLVDDEQPVLDGLSAALRKFFPDIDICGFAKTGRAAVEGVSREKPDVVLMDVKMPGISGLDALRELKRLAPDTIPILLTAYERFDIARQAFDLGVYDYLVKPVEQEDLIEAVRGALSRHEERREAALRAIATKNELEIARPFLEEAFLYAVVLGGTPPEGLDDRAAALGFPNAAGRIGVFAPMRRGAGFDDLAGEFAKKFRTELAFHVPCAVGAPIRGLVPFFIPAGSEGDAEGAAMEAAADCGGTGTEARIGPETDAAGLHRSWIATVSALGADSSDSEGNWIRTAEQAIGAIAEGDAVSALASFRALAGMILGEGPEGRVKIAEVAAVAGGMLAAAGADAAGIAAWGNGWNGGAEDATDLLGGALAAIGAGQDARGGDSDKRVRATLGYIAERYPSAISLDDAAERVGLSAARLSRLLTEETGKSFMEHLTEARLDRARSELARGTRSVKEIAADCGYPDANYFSRAFKKAVGLTPSEYANRHGRSIV